MWNVKCRRNGGRERSRATEKETDCREGDLGLVSKPGLAQAAQGVTETVPGVSPTRMRAMKAEETPEE